MVASRSLGSFLLPFLVAAIGISVTLVVLMESAGLVYPMPD
jgi:hypothetical protein